MQIKLIKFYFAFCLQLPDFALELKILLNYVIWIMNNICKREFLKLYLNSSNNKLLKVLKKYNIMIMWCDNGFLAL